MSNPTDAALALLSDRISSLAAHMDGLRRQVERLESGTFVPTCKLCRADHWPPCDGETILVVGAPITVNKIMDAVLDLEKLRQFNADYATATAKRNEVRMLVTKLYNSVVSKP